MTHPPAPLSGRRATLGAAAVLAGYILLAPPLYLLGPFALLTLVSRPRTLREVAWLTAALAGIAASFSGSAGLGPRLLEASGLIVAVIFVLVSLRPGVPLFPRALLTVALSAVGVAVWTWATGTGWTALEGALTEMLRASYRTMVELAGTDGTARKDMELFVAPFIQSAPTVARMIPGVLTLQAILGVSLAWHWHHRISVHPRGEAPEGFTAFRFNDHLVWGAIFTLGMVLLPLPPPIGVLALNLLIVWVGLYAARGLAVVASFLAAAPTLLKLLASVFALLLAPLVLGATVALGLADTWLDIRGRFAPPAPEGA